MVAYFKVGPVGLRRGSHVPKGRLERLVILRNQAHAARGALARAAEHTHGESGQRGTFLLLLRGLLLRHEDDAHGFRRQLQVARLRDGRRSDYLNLERLLLELLAPRGCTLVG